MNKKEVKKIRFIQDCLKSMHGELVVTQEPEVE
jgi:hypothetical protein